MNIKNQNDAALAALSRGRRSGVRMTMSEISTYSQYESFSSKELSFLPDKITLDSAYVTFIGDAICSVRIEYFNTEGYSWYRNGVPTDGGVLTLLQSYLGPEAYLDVDVTRPFRIEKVALNDVEALLIDRNYSTGHLGSDSYWNELFNACLVWIDEGIYYELSSSMLSASVINEETFIAIALSLV